MGQLQAVEFLIGNKVVGKLTTNRITVGAFDSYAAMARLSELTLENRRQAAELRELRTQVRTLVKAIKTLQSD